MKLCETCGHQAHDGMQYVMRGECDGCAECAQTPPDQPECPYCGRVMTFREKWEQGSCNDCYEDRRGPDVPSWA